MSSAVLSEIRNGAMWITLNRPDALNALTPEVVSGVNAAIDRAVSDSEIKAVVLTGAANRNE